MSMYPEDAFSDVDFLLALRALVFNDQPRGEIITVRVGWIRRIVEMAERNQPSGPYPMKPGDDQFGGGRDSPFRT